MLRARETALRATPVLLGVTRCTARSLRASACRAASTDAKPAHPGVEASRAVMDGLVNWRWAARDFDPALGVADEDLEAVMEAARRAPSSLNLEPWRAVVVRSDEGRERLATAMLAANADRVRHAPVSIVMLADLEAMRDVDNVVRREAEAGKPREYTDGLPTKAAVFAGGAMGKAGDAMRLGAFALAATVSGVALPTPQPAEAWASKQLGIATGFMLVAAAARGLAAAPMEGLDAHRARAAVGASSRFAVPLVVALGYAPGTEMGEGAASARPVPLGSPRRPLSETVSLETLGEAFPAGGARR